MSVIEIGRGDSKTYRNDSLKAWLRSIRGYKVLTPTEEENVIARYKSGEEEMLDVIMKGCQRFLLAAAKSYSCNADVILELISEGNIALMEAIKRFDMTYGVRFLSYAAYYIKKAMTEWVYRGGIVKSCVSPEVKVYAKSLREEWKCKYGYDMPEWAVTDKVNEKFEDKFNRGTSITKHVEVIYNEDTVLEDRVESGVIERYTKSYNTALETLGNEDNMTEVSTLINSVCQTELECAVLVYGYGLFGKQQLTDFHIGRIFGVDVDKIGTTRINLMKRLRKFMNHEKLKKKPKKGGFDDFIKNEL